MFLLSCKTRRPGLGTAGRRIIGMPRLQAGSKRLQFDHVHFVLQGGAERLYGDCSRSELPLGDRTGCRAGWLRPAARTLRMPLESMYYGVFA